METQCRWFCHLEDVKAHRPDSVLWYKQGYEEGPPIFPAGSTPTGFFTKMGTMASLAQAMQQALATDRRLQQSLKDCDAITIHAQISQQGTRYSFHPAYARSAFAGWLSEL